MSSPDIRRQRNVFIIVLYFFVTTMFWLDFCNPGFMVRPCSNFKHMLDKTACRPYVGRMLTPLILLGVEKVIPQHVQNQFLRCRVGRWLYDICLSHTDDTKSSIPKHHEIAYCVMLGFFWLCFAGVLYYMWMLARFWLKNFVLITLAPIVGFFIIHIMMVEIHFLYDPATLLLATAAAYYLSINRKAGYYISFLLLTVNKETSIVLVPLFYIRNKAKMSGKKVLLHSFLQVLMFVVIRGLISHAVSGNRGPAIEFHLLDHNLCTAAPLNKLYSLAVTIFLWFLASFDWKNKPAFLRSALLITAGVLVGSTLFFGWIDELRDYYECVPYLCILVMYTLGKFFDLEPDESVVTNNYEC